MDPLTGKITFKDPALVLSPLVITHLTQGHGPACRFFRHIQIDVYSLSLIGEPKSPGHLQSNYELRLFERINDKLFPIGCPVPALTKNRALELFSLAEKKIQYTLHCAAKASATHIDV